jgi:hypothetical protein
LNIFKKVYMDYYRVNNLRNMEDVNHAIDYYKDKNIDIHYELVRRYGSEEEYNNLRKEIDGWRWDD